MKLVVGLGNPGPQYAKTRHNLGFQVVDGLRGELQWGPSVPFVGSELVEAKRGGERLLLLKPGQYMNRSGRPVTEVAVQNGVEPESILVIYDDLDLAPGRIRLRAGGGSGGHRGVEDISHLLSPEFHRLRVGIGRPLAAATGSAEDAAVAEVAVPVPIEEYVLQPFSGPEEAIMEDARERAIQATLSWIDEGIVKAMDRFNRKS